MPLPCGDHRVALQDGPCCCSCDGCCEVTYDLTYTASGTCNSGIAVSTIVPGHAAGTAKFHSESGGGATFCDGFVPNDIDNGNGQLQLTCSGADPYILNLFLSTLLVKVLTDGTLDGIPFVAGDWVLLIGSITYDFATLGDCGACTGTFVSPTAIKVLPDITNTHTVTQGGITSVITLEFSFDSTSGCKPSDCPNITVSYDQISADKLKCGFVCPGIAGHPCGGGSCPPPHGYYLTSNQSYTMHESGHADYCSICSWCDTTLPTSLRYALNGSGDCTSETAAPTGCTTANFANCNNCDGHTPPPCCSADPTCSSTFTCPGGGDPLSCCTNTRTTNPTDVCYNLTDEYTTAMLQSFVDAAVPPYDNDFNDNGEAFTLLESFDTANKNQDHYAIAKFRPKFSISEARGSDLLICYNEYGAGDYTPRTVTIPAGQTFVIGSEVIPLDNKQVVVITDVGCGGPPIVETTAAADVTGSTAKLKGTVNPNGPETTVHFEYGITTSYGTSTADQTFTGRNVQDVDEDISGLSPSTTYHFRIVATNVAGSDTGDDQTFTTTA